MEHLVCAVTAPESFLVGHLNTSHLQNCYQCGKCTAGCPVAARMDTAPNQLLRLLQLGNTAAALRSEAIWHCVSCQTCSSRCPKEVDCAAIIDVLRETALVGDLVPAAARQVVAFQRAFLESIKHHGRLYELELISRFKAATARQTGRWGILFRDAGLAPQLQKRKKLHFLPERTRDHGVVERIFERCAHGPEL